MPKSLSALGMLLLALLLLPLAASAAEKAEPGLRERAKARPVKVIARLRTPPSGTAAPGTGSELAVRGRMAGVGVARMRRLGSLPLVALEVDASQLEALLANDQVASVTPDRLLKPVLAESAPLVAAPGAWNAGFRGAGRTVAIVDTGVDKSHPFLQGKVVAEACFSAPQTPAASVRAGRAVPATAPGIRVRCGAVTMARMWRASPWAGARASRGSHPTPDSSPSRSSPGSTMISNATTFPPASAQLNPTSSPRWTTSPA
jgi:subtilisin family serine protease